MRLADYLAQADILDEDERERRFHDEQDLLIELAEWQDREDEKAGDWSRFRRSELWR